MHDDEIDIDVGFVGRSLLTQFPRWADLPLEPISSTGPDNAGERGVDLSGEQQTKTKTALEYFSSLLKG
ncbi:MAG: hypothetical protein WEE53_06195 [Acidimicrobiia bacterium]